LASWLRYKMPREEEPIVEDVGKIVTKIVKEIEPAIRQEYNP